MDANGAVPGLMAELKILRRGRGVHAPEIGDRVGPALRDVCGIVRDDTPAVVRQKVADRLVVLADRLPDDLKVAVLAAFGLADGARHQFYRERIRWAGVQLDRDDRTVRRRIDDGIVQLAQAAVAEVAERPAVGEAGPSTEWRTDTLRALLNLEREAPEAFEFRRIVSERDDLREIDLSVTLTAGPDGSTNAPAALAIDVLYGGRLVRRRMETARRYGLSLWLPRPLARDEPHDFALRFTLPGGEPMRPHFVCVTRQACELLEVRVKFDEKRPPHAVWKLNRVFQDDLDDPASRGDEIPVDPVGELRMDFRQPTPGFAYGVQWDVDDAF